RRHARPAGAVPPRRVRLRLRDRLVPARRADAARLPQSVRGHRPVRTLDGAGEARRGERGDRKMAGHRRAGHLADVTVRDRTMTTAPTIDHGRRTFLKGVAATATAATLGPLIVADRTIRRTQ